MINLAMLTSILEQHKLSDEQSEELQKVIYSIDDGRLAPVFHREWNENSGVYSCSGCGYSFEHEGYQAYFNYCPNCGAKMDGGADNA